MLADSAKLALPNRGRTLCFMLMSASGQSRRFDCEPITSDLHRTPDMPPRRNNWRYVPKSGPDVRSRRCINNRLTLTATRIVY
jgi:hypothetical protein